MNILKFKWLFFLISALVIIPGLVSLIMFGFKVGLDFTGGSMLEVALTQQPSQSLNLDEVKTQLRTVYDFESVQRTTQSDQEQLLIRGKELDGTGKDQILGLLSINYGQVEVLRFETVGPVLGKELLQKTILAVGLVAIFITIYVWSHFKKLEFGVCAILATFHDTLVLLGVFSLLGKFMGVEVDVLFVTAVLTTLSFSIHDTIVIFNRIKELQAKHQRQNFTTVANVAIWETLARSINNSMTIIIMLLALVVLGGETIRWFSVALLVGAITGTYSSTFNAVPLLSLWSDWQEKRKKNK